MEKHITNPWKWQDNLGYAQAVEVKNNKGTLYCAGQAAINAEGQPVDVNMSEQITLSLSNLEQVIKQAGYHPQNIVRINYYTTSINDFFAAYGDVMGWIGEHHVAASSTLIEVKALAFPQLLVEIEATVVE
jgi:2-iminobutanoate/2-iminopropanoate deaminase